VNKAFEKIALLEGVIAAAFVSDAGKLVGWCANSVITPDNLCFIAETCRSVLSANRAEQRAAHTGVVAFGNRTLVFREGEPGIFMVYLDSPVNDEVLAWLFEQIDPLLAEEGVKLD
jgi:roadblock/LC7 domain-containing protein